MKALRTLAAALLVLGLAGAAAAEHHETDLMKEVEAIGDVLAEAMVANDLDTMLGMYLEDAISLPNFSPRMQGMEAFRQNHAQMEASGMKVKSFESAPTEVWQAGDHVIEIGNYQIQLDMAGMPIQDVGKYVTVYVRDADGKLKIKLETWNTDVMPGMPGAMPGGGEAGAEEGAEMNDGREG